MNKLSKDPIDQFFKEALKSPDLKYNKQDWKGLEARLPRKSKNKTIAWLLPVAAALLIFLSLWLTDGSKTENNPLSKAGMGSAARDSQSAGIDKEQKYTNDDNIRSRTSSAPALKKSSESNPFEAVSALKTLRSELSSTTSGKIADYNNIDHLLPTKSLIMPEHSGLANTEFATPDVNDTNLLSTLPEPAVNSSEKKPGEKVNSRLSLAFSFSPDINTVNHFAENDIGASIGVGASYKISKNLSLQAAIGYSKKAYSASPYEYKAPWSGSNAAKYAESIDADCRVLDIPVNLRYTFASSPKKAFFISGGLSSYIMLEETYTLVGKPSSGYPAYTDPSYSYKNENKHPLSVANFSAGISKPLNKQASVVIQPYVKLPLTGIGQGKVNLQSTGIIFQLEYNLTKKQKVSPSGGAQ